MSYIKTVFLFSVLSFQFLWADINITDKFTTILQKLTHSQDALNNNTSIDTMTREERRAKLEESIKKIEALKNQESTLQGNQDKTVEELEENLESIQKAQLESELFVEKMKLLDELKQIDEYFNKENIWSTVYVNYETYKGLELKQENLHKRINILNKKKKKTEKDKSALRKYKEDLKTTEGKLIQLKEYKKEPFEELLKPIAIGETPQVNSPLDMIQAVSFQKHLVAVEEDYRIRRDSLEQTVEKLQQKRDILEHLKELNVTVDNEEDDLVLTIQKFRTFRSQLDIIQTRQTVLVQEINGLKMNINDAISKEIEKGIVIGSIVLFLLSVFFLIKYLVRKYMSENELFYSTNKAINITFITIVLLTLLFSYLENVGHLVTILSFASAGIAIALKDWFMSIMGWLVIIFSGSIHVGDRIRVSRDGNEYVGDVVDISLLRMTLHEDVTLTTDMVNRRAGRILFIPNNYIFTEMISNYSHSGLKTVWDGIDFIITFDSDVSKAQSIAKDVSRKYSKGYTDMTRKQLNKLRSKYSMRNTSVEPRIFAFLDEHGVRISVWYLTNAYATLTLRSTISMEILSRIQKDDTISIAFPSQSLYMDKAAPILPESKEPAGIESIEDASKKPASKYKPDDWGLY